MKRHTRTARTRIAVAAALFAPALLLTACGQSMTVTGENGEKIDVGQSGISVTSTDGSMQIGGNVSVPAGYPADEVPLPSCFTPAAAMTSQQNGKDAYSLTLQADGDKTAEMRSYLDQLKASGFAVDGDLDNTVSSSEGTGLIVQLKSSQWTVNVISSASGDKTVVQLTVAPATS
jgi:hypothetical protein